MNQYTEILKKLEHGLGLKALFDLNNNFRTISGFSGAFGHFLVAEFLRINPQTLVITASQKDLAPLTFDITNYTPPPTAIPLTITNRDDEEGSFTLVIDDSSWDLIDSDAEMAINSNDGAGFSGRIKISFPAVGSTPAEDNIIFLLFIVRSDGIVKI